MPAGRTSSDSPPRRRRDDRRVLTVHAVLTGDDARPPIVLVHGAADAGLVWRFWPAELATRGWSSWALDLRGHGASPAHDLGRTSMADYAADVAAPRRGGVRGARSQPAGPGAGRGGEPARGRVTMPDLDGEERRLALASLGAESRRARDERKAGVARSRPRATPTSPCQPRPRAEPAAARDPGPRRARLDQPGDARTGRRPRAARALISRHAQPHPTSSTTNTTFASQKRGHALKRQPSHSFTSVRAMIWWRK